MRAQLEYRLGVVMVESGGSLQGWLRMPRALMAEVRAFKADQRMNSAEVLPLGDYDDAEEAERIKRRRPYLLGSALVKNGGSPLRWPVLPFAMLRALRKTPKKPRGSGSVRGVPSRPRPQRKAAEDAAAPAETESVSYYIDPDAPTRLPLEEMVRRLSAHDVISFDIFDTAIVRAVAKPTDVFRIMGLRLGVTGFVKKRRDAESHVRSRNDRLRGTREVSLREIHEVLGERQGATEQWEQLEKDLEIQLARRNPYIFAVYQKLREMGKTLVFTSDMYLPRETIETILARVGYAGYERLYLSHEHGARKGDGTLQKVLIADYGPERSIVHVGDVHAADVEKSVSAGIAAVHNPDQHVLVREKDMGSLSGSFYEAVIDNALGTGTWTEGLHYTHGFRTGGILALGYVEFLERLATEKKVDKILFLGRDCDVLFQIYRRFFGQHASEYAGISRSASLMITVDSNYDDFISRTFFRWLVESNNSRTIGQLLVDTGFDYLVDHLEQEDVEALQFPSSASEARLRDFFWAKKGVVEAHLAETVSAAREYFGNAVGDAKKVLVVDVGWAGTCITTLRDFFRANFGDRAPEVVGALLGTARSDQVSDAVSSGLISSFIYSPVMNLDIARLVMPGDRKMPTKVKDLRTHPLEYLFTEPEATTVGYTRDASGRATVVRGSNVPPNPQQILDMQRGVLDFVERYLEYSQGLGDLRTINAYTAFQPLRNALGQRPYLYAVYKDFLYDAVSVLHGDVSVFERFGSLFDPAEQHVAGEQFAPDSAAETEVARPRILFVSPEMTYTGTPRSLLRLCGVASSLGYEPVVWAAKAGPFAREFEALGIPVKVVPDAAIDHAMIDTLVQDNVKLAVCNTVATDGYVHALEGKLPLVWYVREATNVPQFLRGHARRAATLRRSSSVTVVSDYAARAVEAHADGPIEVVKNAVEDVSNLALPYLPGKGGVVRFVQLGTIEHRKGYDVFVAAYKAMPESYRGRAELHFAGGFINSGTSFASYLFGQIKGEPAVHFHGLIVDSRKKIELLSQMDVVVVASRDESCSLVALEGAMLSKPLIVTENVGAKYMVGEDNGVVVPSAQVTALRDAFMRMIDASPAELEAMGAASRRKYDELASMEAHRRELGELFARRIAAGPATLASPKHHADPVRRPPLTDMRETIVSLTSFPPRMPTIAACIKSLKRQTRNPDRILLWLSEDQFPERLDGLPEELRDLVDDQFQIRWVKGDLVAHKKYVYAMREFPEALVIIVDDDVRYPKELVATLVHGHLERPFSVVAGRCNLIRFRPDGSLRGYDNWALGYQHLRETETYALLPTGIGGVLYPPGALPPEAFDVDAIKATSARADDLWLKAMATANGFPTWMPSRKLVYPHIDGSQRVALWRENAFQSGNDLAMRAIIAFLEENYGIGDAVLRRIQGVRADGTFFGPGDEIDRSPLIRSGEGLGKRLPSPATVPSDVSRVALHDG